MATYKGNDITKPDPLDADIKRTMQPRPGLENIEEDLNLPPSAEPDYMRKPGQKGYMENQQMADPVVRTPLNMRPRSTPNAEINAQNRDQVLRDMGKLPPAPPVADVPMRGYQSGGGVRKKLDDPTREEAYDPELDVNNRGYKPPPAAPAPAAPAPRPSRMVGEPPFSSRQGMGDPNLRRNSSSQGIGLAYNQGGMVKHGSSTRVSCKTKHGG